MHSRSIIYIYENGMLVLTGQKGCQIADGVSVWDKIMCYETDLGFTTQPRMTLNSWPSFFYYLSPWIACLVCCSRLLTLLLVVLEECHAAVSGVSATVPWPPFSRISLCSLGWHWILPASVSIVLTLDTCFTTTAPCMPVVGGQWQRLVSINNQYISIILSAFLLVDVC